MSKQIMIRILAVAALVLGALLATASGDLPSGASTAVPPAPAGTADSAGVSRTPSPAREAIPPIETFVQIGYAGSPEQSEDGSTVLFTTSMAGTDQVYLMLRSGWPYQLTAFVDGIDFYRVSATGSKVVVGASTGGSEQSNLFLIDTDTFLVTPLKQAGKVQHGSPVWSPDERYVYFRSNEEVSTDFYVYRIDIVSKAVERVWQHAGWNEPVAVSADGTKLLVSHVASSYDSDLYLVDLATGKQTLLTKHDGDYVFDYARLTPDMKYVYFVTNLNDDGMKRVARMALPAGKIEFLNADSPWETEEMDLSNDGEYLAWIENVEGYSEVFAVDLVDSARIELNEMKGLASAIDVSSSGTMLFVFENAISPPDVWKYDIEEGDLDKITHSTLAGVDPGLFVEPELVHYKSFDGLGIPAFLYLPRSRPAGPIPFIMEIHGGPENQFRPGFARNLQYLLLDGYGILAPNIRGSSGYGREYMALDNYKNRPNAIRDIYEGAKWLVDNGYAAYGKIGIKGGSYGGYATLAALAGYPEVFGAGLDDVGPANFITLLRNTAPYRRALREAEYGPLADSTFLRQISPLTDAARIKAPLLIVHGANDPRVPVSEARQMAAAIRADGGVVDTLIFADEGHGAAKLSNRLVYYRRMVEFFDKYLK